MLQYLSMGERKFGRVPIQPYARLNWEFYAVLRGRCGVLLETSREDLRESTLWVFPPGHVHGWHGDRKTCRIAAFHFGFVPEVLQRQLGNSPWLERRLSPEEGGALAEAARHLRRHYQSRSAVSTVHFHRALLDLSLLFLEEESGGAYSHSAQRMEQKVEAALAWYRRNLAQRPSLEDMAAAVNVSPSHLRRLFVAVRGHSPHDAIVHLKIEAAQSLLGETDLKLEAVAGESGFSGATDLCRIFKARVGCSPTRWRATILPSFDKHPSSRGSAVANYEI